MRAATFDGTGSWKDYRAHFDAVAELNDWSPVEKDLYLAVSLRRQAQGVFGNISTQSKDYDSKAGPCFRGTVCSTKPNRTVQGTAVRMATNCLRDALSNGTGHS